MRQKEVAEKRSAAISLCGQPPLTFITPTNRQQWGRTTKAKSNIRNIKYKKKEKNQNNIIKNKHYPTTETIGTSKNKYKNRDKGMCNKMKGKNCIRGSACVLPEQKSRCRLLIEQFSYANCIGRILAPACSLRNLNCCCLHSHFSSAWKKLIFMVVISYM